MSDTQGVRIGVYRDAYDFHRKRTALLPEAFYSRAMDRARPRAMTVTGLDKMDALLAVLRVTDDGIAKSKTTPEIANDVAKIIDKNGGTILPGSRFELIVHNALFTANAAGEWKAAMEFVEDRPYFQYRGPRDGRNSAICKPLHGMIVHYTDPILRHYWHPNHHWERQQWVSLAADEVDEKLLYRSPDGFEYPVVNGQTLRPADGWDFNAADTMAADDKVFVDGIRALGQPVTRKTPSDYGLSAIDEIDTDDLPRALHLGNPVPMGAIESAWKTFQRMVGIENESGTWVLDYAKDGLRINRDSFDLALTDSEGNFAGGNGRYFPLILPTLLDPFEVWLVPFAGKNGTTFIKRYIGAFAGPRGTLETLVLDRSDEGWLWRTIRPRNIEAYRLGLLARTKSTRK